MMTWWRQNAWALLISAVLYSATMGALAWQEWGTYNSGHPTQPVEGGQAGTQVEYGSATIGPVAARFYDDPDAPEGSRVVRVRVPIEPGDEVLACPFPVLREATGSGRQWDEASSKLGRGFDDDITLCPSDATEPYEMSLEYLVPADATGPFYLEIVSAESLPSYARLTVEPEGR